MNAPSSQDERSTRRARGAAIVATLAHAATIALIAGACSITTEVLPRFASDGGPESVTPTRRHYDFCPTSIDVYGGPNVQLSGCQYAGPSQGYAPELGYFAPGLADYDRSLAGGLQASLSNDATLTARFGSIWKVRSCATGRGTVMQLAPLPPLDIDNCGPDTPPMMGSASTLCTAAPAPVLLISAENMDDRCHGGGPDSGQSPDPDLYAAHMAMRLDAFIASRAPKVALVGAQTQWMPVGVGGGGGGGPPQLDLRSCQGKRSEWNPKGVMAWAAHLDPTSPHRAVADEQDKFKKHHPCCSLLGFTGCDTNWYCDPGVLLNPAGAGEMVSYWYEQIATFLRDNDFECP